MRKKFQKSFLTLLLCAALAGTSILPVLQADASEAETESTGETVQAEETTSGKEEENAETTEKEEAEETETENGSEEGKSEESEDTGETQELVPGVEYQAHVQSYGWQSAVSDGAAAGTTGEAKRVEAIKMQLANLPEEYAGSSIKYSVHVQTYGWKDAVSDGASAGTTGEAKRLEAITVELEGPIAEDYSVYYRTHIQTYGWLDWACDGAKAGSAQYGKRMEAIEIKLVKKGAQDAPEITGNAYKCPLVGYQAHVQTYGWRSTVYDNSICGVTGQSKRLEALKITLPDVEGTTGYTGGISYQAYVQGTGWQSEKSNGELAGTSGAGKRIEALKIWLTGDVAEYYDVYYSLHLAKIGWTNYTCGSSTAVAGSTELSKKIEAVKVKLVKKGDEAPAAGGTTYIAGYKSSDFFYTGKIQGSGTTGCIGQGQTVGTTGQSKRLEGITLYLNRDESNAYLPSGSIQYATHLSSTGWTGWSTQGSFSGSADGSHGMEAVKMQLTGDLSKYYDIYYRAYVQKYGWLGWAKNGQTAGTTKIGYRLEALQIRLVSKDAAAPGANSRYYTETKFYTGPDASMAAKANLYSSPTNYLIMVDGRTHKVGIYRGTKGLWSNVKYWSCGDGKASTPTVRGVFSVGNKGYYFNSGAYRCFWYTQFYGSYLFHSVLCWPNGSIADGRVGLGISHGCVRLEVQNAKWIYDNIPRGTTVVVYN